jgi:glycosyltransferase involved in cell wall biosynthesis
MNGATVLLFPSLTEGCPVTMLEAFACGLPIVASKRGGLWDVGRNVALFVDEPEDYAGFARHLRRLWNDPSLREQIRRAGLSEAQKYTWQAAAEGHLLCYQKALRPRSAQYV